MIIIIIIVIIIIITTTIRLVIALGLNKKGLEKLDGFHSDVIKL